jgi:hypothetical protein
MPLLREWFQVTHSDIRLPSGMVVSTRGAARQVHISNAMAQAQPLIDVVLSAGDLATAKRLKEDFYATVAQLRRAALNEEISAAIDAATVSFAGLPKLAMVTEEEKIKLGVNEALSTIRLLNTTLNRLLSASAADLAKKAELDLLFKRITAQAIEAGETPHSDVLSAAVKMDLPAALLFIKGGLDGINAILSVDDPGKRAKLFERHHTVFGKVAQGAALLTILGQFLHGAAAVVGAATYSVASVMGKTEIASQVLAKGIPALSNINLILNAIGVVHGFSVLLDREATSKEKAKAVLEIGVGGAGILGRFIAGFSLPATVSVVINFYTIKAVLEKGAEAYVNLIQGGLTICFKDMRETARYVSTTATRLAVALEMARHETNAERKEELNRQAFYLRWNLVDFFLKPYIKRATTSYGARNEDPGAYGPALIDRFKPLAEKKMDTNAQALEAAAQFIQIVGRCFAEPEKILQGAANWAWARAN